MPAGQNHSNFALNTRLSAPRYDTWCKIQVLKTLLYSEDPLSLSNRCVACLRMGAVVFDSFRYLL